VLTYGAETLTILSASKFSKMESAMLGLKLRDHITNLSELDIIVRIPTMKWNWIRESQDGAP